MVRARGRRGRAGRSAASRRSGAREEDDTEAYLRQAIATSARIGAEGRPVKKRRVAGKLVLEPASDDDEAKQEIDPKAEREATPVEAPTQQTAYADSEDSDDSDFEDVDLSGAAVGAGSSPRATSEPPEELNIVLGKKDGDSTKASPRRKGVTAKERQLRLEIHKVHVLCLVSHVSIRNHWCNDASIQATMRNILSKRTIGFLVDDETQSQFQRSQRFKEGMEQALESFSQNFRISSRGMARSFWAENAEEIARLDIPDDIDLPMQKADFRKCAIDRNASRDVGAQLFCAMLRSLGMDVRLVCSLQPLPITSAAKGVAPEIRKIASTVPHKETRIGFSPGPDRVSDSSANEGASPKPRGAPIASRLTPSRNRAVTPSRAGSSSSRPSGEVRKRRMPESRFPVYWVEVLEQAYQRWTPVDPLVTKTIGKPAKLEPPASDQQNAMSYVIAFEEDGSARDVTKRYTKAYNAKTRKLRIEATKNGERWWKRVLRLYRKKLQEPRDQIEDRQLAQKEAAEEMPKNIQDFKDHPYYALKRHLRKSEVIHPERQIGKVFTGKILGNENKESEPVYRRKDVFTVKSADSWYRLGREVKSEEVPLKWATPRTSKSKIPEEPDPEEQDSAGTPLFAAYQTAIYRPPPVVRGHIPKNRFGNLDIYTPSMIPPGGVHVAHPGARNAARVLGIDYADAVVGFEFRGRQGTAVIRGAVIATQYADSLVDIIHGFAYDQAADAAELRSEKALKLWRHFLSALRIRERIQGYAVEGEGEEEEDNGSAYASDNETLEDDFDDAHSPEVEFLPDYETFLKAQPSIEIVHSTASQTPAENPPKQLNKEQTPPANQTQQTTNGEITVEDGTAAAGGFMVDDEEANHDSGGGFLMEGDDGSHGVGGGFVTEAATEPGGFVQDSEPDCDIPMQSTEDGGGKEFKQRPTAHTKLGSENDTPQSPEASQLQKEAAQELEEVEMAEAPCPATGSPSQSQREGEAGAEAAEQESDKGSLLSHDPEDDDADPEWLM